MAELTSDEVNEIISPLSKVHEVIRQCRQKISDKGYQAYLLKIPVDLDINWNLKGAVAGKAFSSDKEIRLNYGLYIRNKETFLKQTVPHEWCHIAADHIFGIRAHHGAEWCHLMKLLDLEPNRCHSYDVSEVKRHKKVTYYSAKCNCRTHTVSSVLVGKIMRGKKYRCKRCKGDISI